jgi:hypothetical protein
MEQIKKYRQQADECRAQAERQFDPNTWDLMLYWPSIGIPPLKKRASRVTRLHTRAGFAARPRCKVHRLGPES